MLFCTAAFPEDPFETVGRVVKSWREVTVSLRKNSNDGSGRGLQDGWIKAAVAGDNFIKMEDKAAVKVSPKEDVSMLPPSPLKTGVAFI